MKIVISIGGSLLTKDTSLSNPDTYTKNFNRYAKTIKQLYDDGNQLVVVCGGGISARMFQKIGRHFTKDVELLDRLGIIATDLNAYLFIAALEKMESGIVHDVVLKEPNDVNYVGFETEWKKIIVCSGWEPGCSTDMDAALQAESIGAEIVINATSIDGVYTKDPKQYADAKKLDKLSYTEFREILSALPQTPGEYRLFDLKAVDVLQRKNIKLIIIDGNDPEEILCAAGGGEHKGTIVG